MRSAAAVLAGGLLLIVVAAMPSHPQIPSGRDVVSAAAYASFDPVARASSFQIAVIMKIRNGFHVNAREKSADYLIATDLRAEGPAAGFKVGDVFYPKGELRTFSFSKKPLNVYEDQVILRMELSASADTPLGAQHVPLKLRYQACSHEVCLPPVTKDVDAAFRVTASASDSRPAHPELFPSQR